MEEKFGYGYITIAYLLGVICCFLVQMYAVAVYKFGLG